MKTKLEHIIDLIEDYNLNKAELDAVIKACARRNDIINIFSKEDFAQLLDIARIIEYYLTKFSYTKRFETISEINFEFSISAEFEAMCLHNLKTNYIVDINKLDKTIIKYQEELQGHIDDFKEIILKYKDNIVPYSVIGIYRLMLEYISENEHAIKSII